MRRDKPTYPTNWRDLARRVKERANWKCEMCGAEHGSATMGAKGPYRVIITVHHPDADTENPEAKLVALCQPCHLREDAQMHAIHAQETNRAKRITKQIEAGQMKLEIEQASGGVH